MTKITANPTWPVVIHYANDPELDLIDSQAQWNARDDLIQFDFQTDDRIIVCNGWVFEFAINSPDSSKAVCSGKRIHLDDLLGLIKAHMSEAGACCVAKLYAPDYAEAFKIIIDAKKSEA